MSNAELELILKDDTTTHTFMLTPHEVLLLISMPYKLMSSNEPDLKPSHINIQSNIPLDIYRLWNELEFKFNDKSILVNVNFKELEKELTRIWENLAQGNSEKLQLK
ncbi:MAG: hypothetical protein DRG78_05750 [Epsilonproteobacteria bacterium]|nr:MAG: hypothetical protein DRG78_05750 [Campylobacterota bacterium]